MVRSNMAKNLGGRRERIARKVQRSDARAKGLIGRKGKDKLNNQKEEL